MQSEHQYYPIPEDATVGMAGISVRDKLAESAMNALVKAKFTFIHSADGACQFDADIISENAYLLADAMIKQSQINHQ